MLGLVGWFSMIPTLGRWKCLDTVSSKQERTRICHCAAPTDSLSLVGVGPTCCRNLPRWWFQSNSFRSSALWGEWPLVYLNRSASNLTWLYCSHRQTVLIAATFGNCAGSHFVGSANNQGGSGVSAAITKQASGVVMMIRQQTAWFAWARIFSVFLDLGVLLWVKRCHCELEDMQCNVKSVESIESSW